MLYADFDDPKAAFLNSIESIKEGRSKEDVLYEVLLKYGIELTTYVEEEVINEEKILNNDGNYEGWHSVKGIDVEGNICVHGKVHVYLRKR